MKAATVSRLKASLSEYLSKVRAGEELIVTERGKPIVKIVPLHRDDTALAPHLQDLERRGAVRVGTGRLPPGFLSGDRPQDPEGRVLQSLLEEREDAR